LAASVKPVQSSGRNVDELLQFYKIRYLNWAFFCISRNRINRVNDMKGISLSECLALRKEGSRDCDAILGCLFLPPKTTGRESNLYRNQEYPEQIIFFVLNLKSRIP